MIQDLIEFDKKAKEMEGSIIYEDIGNAQEEIEMIQKNIDREQYVLDEIVKKYKDLDQFIQHYNESQIKIEKQQTNMNEFRLKLKNAENELEKLSRDKQNDEY